MAISASELNVILSARDKEFNRALARANKQVDKFKAQSDRNLKQVTKSFGGLSKAAKALAPILAGVFSVRAVNNIVNSTAGIADLSRLAGVSATEFQKMAAAARTVGIEQDKFSDIIKDVNDKVGDYLITGAGPLADFFETIAPLVGVTADQFRDLSGPDALQLYVNSLQKANVSQAQMTFFLEAIASDATALLPLLNDNGSELKRLGDEAERAGRIMSEDAVNGAVKMREEFQSLTGQMETLIKEALLENADDIIAIVRTMTDDILPKVLDAAGAVAAFINGGPPGGAQISSEQAAIDKAADDAAFAEGSKPGGFNASDPSGTGNFMVDPESGAIIDLADPASSGLALEALAAIGARGGAKPKEKKIKTAKELQAEADAAKAAAKAIDKAKNAYQGLLNSIDPVSAAQFEYNKQLQIMDQYEKLTGQSIENKSQIVDQLKASMQRAKDEASGFSAVTDALEQGLTNAFMAGLEGADSFKDAMRQTASAVIKELYRVLVVQQMVNALMGAFGFSPVPGGGFTRTGAGGRSLQAGTPYMTGESGRELFVPSTSGRLLSPAQTNNALSGGGDVIVQQTINVTTGVQQTVRNEIKSMMPQIAESAKSAVADARQRGGSYRRALG